LLRQINTVSIRPDHVWLCSLDREEVGSKALACCVAQDACHAVFAGRSTGKQQWRPPAKEPQTVPQVLAKHVSTTPVASNSTTSIAHGWQ
jgi:hypothetical protein